MPNISVMEYNMPVERLYDTGGLEWLLGESMDDDFERVYDHYAKKAYEIAQTIQHTDASNEVVFLMGCMLGTIGSLIKELDKFKKISDDVGS